MRTNLELLILALVGRGLRTAYDMNSRAGISVAAALAALARLEKDRLVEGKSGPRRSRRYELTTAGRRTLRQDLVKCAAECPADLESIVRSAYLLWLQGKISSARTFLARCAEAREVLASSAAQTERVLASEENPAHSGLGHRWMRAAIATETLRTEAKAMRALIPRLKQRKP